MKAKPTNSQVEFALAAMAKIDAVDTSNMSYAQKRRLAAWRRVHFEVVELAYQYPKNAY